MLNNIIFISTVSIFMIVAHIMIEDSNRVVRYDCRMVDVSPDMPEDVKRMCRGRR